jgi:hypothetical protein
MSILIFITSHITPDRTYSHKNIPIPLQKQEPTHTTHTLKSHKKPNIPPELILNPDR